MTRTEEPDIIRSMAIEELRRMRDTAELSQASLLTAVPPDERAAVITQYLKYWVTANDKACRFIVKIRKQAFTAKIAGRNEDF